ncbi:MAG: TerB family tellurite resistance protein [Myxococcales bacterium]|nr:TerB family tellurite resistance protein [Myxococcales bacterium]
MADEQRLGRDVFIALAAVGWADGNLEQEEADAIVQLAAEEGLELDEIAEIEKATQKPVEVGKIDTSKMDKADRLFAYAVAAWVARVDGHVSPEEITALNKIAKALRLPDKPRELADRIAIEVGKLNGEDGAKPGFYDLPKLRRAIIAGLVRSRAMKAKASS